MSTWSQQPTQHILFQQHYASVRRDEVVGVLLALFLGGFGAHHFYLRRTGLGILYICFFWCPITWFVSFIECFLMPGRVREFNAIQAAGIAAMLGMPVPVWGQPIQVNVSVPGGAQPGGLPACRRCGNANPAEARFCSACGSAVGL